MEEKKSRQDKFLDSIRSYYTLPKAKQDELKPVFDECVKRYEQGQKIHKTLEEYKPLVMGFYKR